MLLRKPNTISLIKKHNLYKFISDTDEYDAVKIGTRIRLIFEYDESIIENLYNTLTMDIKQQGKDIENDADLRLMINDPVLWRIRKFSQTGEGVRMLVDSIDRIPVKNVLCSFFIHF